VVLFERISAEKTLSSMDQRGPAHHGRIHPYEYGYLTEFQSHEPEFDYLKSLEIEEKINKVRWCYGQSSGKMLVRARPRHAPPHPALLLGSATADVPRYRPPLADQYQ